MTTFQLRTDTGATAETADWPAAVIAAIQTAPHEPVLISRKTEFGPVPIFFSGAEHFTVDQLRRAGLLLA